VTGYPLETTFDSLVKPATSGSFAAIYVCSEYEGSFEILYDSMERFRSSVREGNGVLRSINICCYLSADDQLHFALYMVMFVTLTIALELERRLQPYCLKLTLSCPFTELGLNGPLALRTGLHSFRNLSWISSQSCQSNF
jgi:hypothetical protein